MPNPLHTAQDTYTLVRIKPKGTGILIDRVMKQIAEGKRYKLGKMLGVHAANVGNWLYGQKVDARCCVAIEVLTKGKVKAYQLRPDVFPAPNNVFPIHFNAHKGMKFADVA